MNYQKLFRLLKKRQIHPTDLIHQGVVSACTLQRLRAGKSVSLYSLDTLCQYLDCSISDIISADSRPVSSLKRSAKGKKRQVQ